MSVSARASPSNAANTSRDKKVPAQHLGPGHRARFNSSSIFSGRLHLPGLLRPHGIRPRALPPHEAEISKIHDRKNKVARFFIRFFRLGSKLVNF